LKGKASTAFWLDATILLGFTGSLAGFLIVTTGM